jgi:predicted acyltransferase
MTHATGRLHALDVFRGMTVAAMILVSTPGSWDSVYPWLEHAPWNGWTPTDLVFPFFLFAMGAAVPFALARRRGVPRHVGVHVMRRAILLFAFGLLLNAIETPPPLRLATFRIPGVLQRIALVYVVVSLATERFSIRSQAGLAIATLVGYWIVLAGAPLTAEDNLGAVIDRHVFGRHMLYPLWDPEGLLSTVPAVATALGGAFAGRWLQQRGDGRGARWLFAAGAAAVVVGLAWSRVLPINKNLWTSSFALFSAGGAALLLAACIVIDNPIPIPTSISISIRNPQSTIRNVCVLPFVALGRNALAAYFLSVGLDAVLARWMVSSAGSLKSVVYRQLFLSWARPCCGAEAASLVYALAYVALWSVVLLEMHRRRLFIRI